MNQPRPNYLKHQFCCKFEISYLLFSFLTWDHLVCCFDLVLVKWGVLILIPNYFIDNQIMDRVIQILRLFMVTIFLFTCNNKQ
jgi:hypothetical protein